MYYDLFLEGPEAFVPVILVSLLFTLVAYGAFPLIFARVQKKRIARRSYRWRCYGINFLVMCLFMAMGEREASIWPYVLWTWVFSAVGVKTLKKRGVLEDIPVVADRHLVEYAAQDLEKTVPAPDASPEPEEPSVEEEKPRGKFCQKCGFELIEGSNFCSRCGSAVVKE